MSLASWGSGKTEALARVQATVGPAELRECVVVDAARQEILGLPELVAVGDSHVRSLGSRAEIVPAFVGSGLQVNFADADSAARLRRRVEALCSVDSTGLHKMLLLTEASARYHIDVLGAGPQDYDQCAARTLENLSCVLRELAGAGCPPRWVLGPVPTFRLDVSALAWRIRDRVMGAALGGDLGDQVQFVDFWDEVEQTDSLSTGGDGIHVGPRLGRAVLERLGMGSGPPDSRLSHRYEFHLSAKRGISDSGTRLVERFPVRISSDVALGAPTSASRNSRRVNRARMLHLERFWRGDTPVGGLGICPAEDLVAHALARTAAGKSDFQALGMTVDPRERWISLAVSAERACDVHLERSQGADEVDNSDSMRSLTRVPREVLRRFRSWRGGWFSETVDLTRPT